MYATLKALGACTLWVLAVTMMVVADLDSHEYLRAWAVLVSVLGSTLGILSSLDYAVQRWGAGERNRMASMLTEERARTEALVERLASQFAERERHLRNVSFDGDG